MWRWRSPACRGANCSRCSTRRCWRGAASTADRAALAAEPARPQGPGATTRRRGLAAAPLFLLLRGAAGSGRIGFGCHVRAVRVRGHVEHLAAGLDLEASGAVVLAAVL